MKLLALHLTNVRKFTAKKASITGIGGGITVVSEANEFGKSTFFDAIHALFFEKYSSSAKPVKSLLPYAGGAVEIAADVETPDGTFRVAKRFLSKKSAKITRLSDGTNIAQDDEAERWISNLLGTASDGPAGLLWVRQGQLDLEADSAKEKSLLMETRRDLLSSVAGEIDTMTGGRRMDRVMRSVAQSLSEITTKTGRKSGLWKAASDEADALEAELTQVTAQVKTLDAALGDRKLAEAAAARLDNPDAKARRETAFAAARTAMDTARAHVGAVQSAQQTHDLAALKFTAAQADLDGFLKAIDGLGDAQAQAQKMQALAKDADDAGQVLSAAVEIAKAGHAKKGAAVAAVRALLDGARRQITARKAQDEATQIASQIAKAQIALSDRNTARAIENASVATASWVQSVEVAAADVARLTAAAQAQSTQLTMSYVGTTRIFRNGAEVPADLPVALNGATKLDLPGLGQMTIHVKAVDGNAAVMLETAQALLGNLLKQAGVATLQDARTQAMARVDAATKAQLAQAILDTLAPNGIDDLRKAKADADLAAKDAHADPLPSMTKLENQLLEAQDAEVAANASLTAQNSEYGIAREAAVKLRAQADAAEQVLMRAEADAGHSDTRDDRRAQKLREQAQSNAVFEATRTELQTVVAAAPDMETASAELKRAEASVTAARNERTQLGERLAALSSQIRTLAGNGIEERRDELAGELATIRSVEARHAGQAAALSRLQAALDGERDAARDTYFGPVQDELKPLLSILHQNAALSFDSESLLPNGLMRDDAEEVLGDLSGGTKEQIAILTRLAFARLFARQGRHMPIILDDALVYSDDDRIIKMFTALTRVAQDQQIIVFSCRQLAFQDLGGARPTVEITDI